MVSQELLSPSGISHTDIYTVLTVPWTSHLVWQRAPGRLSLLCQNDLQTSSYRFMAQSASAQATFALAVAAQPYAFSIGNGCAFTLLSLQHKSFLKAEQTSNDQTWFCHQRARLLPMIFAGWVPRIWVIAWI